MAKEFEVDRKKLGPAKLLDFMTSGFLKVGDAEGLYGRPTGIAEQRWARPPTSPSVPICRSQLPCPHRQPVPHPQETAQLMKMTPPVASVLLPALHEMRLVLPGLEKSAREAVLDAVRDSICHPMQS
jgi:hypothetical protein